MLKLHNFLQNCKTGPTNLLSLRGGAWCITQDKREKFFDLYESAIHTFDEKNYETLVYVPPQSKKLPLFLDIDLRLTGERCIDIQPFIKLAQSASEYLLKDYTTVRFFIVHKERGYIKNKIYKIGAHIYFVNDILVSKKEFADLRNHRRPWIRR